MVVTILYRRRLMLFRWLVTRQDSACRNALRTRHHDGDTQQYGNLAQNQSPFRCYHAVAMADCALPYANSWQGSTTENR